MRGTKRSRVVRARDVTEQELRNGWATERDYVSPAMGAEAVSLRVYRLLPHGGPGPLHFHSRSESVYYVLAGRVAVTLDAERHVLGQGDLAFIAPGTQHAIENVGEDHADMLELYAPAETDFVHIPSLTD